MKIKFHNQKGITTADVIVAVILMTIFVTILIVSSNALTKNNNEQERKAEALYYAINAIETAKSQDFNVFPKAGTDKITDVEGLDDGYISDGEGNPTPYYRTVKVQDFAEIGDNFDKQAEVLKRITVIISYKQENKEETVELSTVVSREE